jgi:transposase
MTINNRYINRAKILEAKFRLLIRFFVHDLDAKTIASLTHLNRNTVNRYLNLIRKRIAEFCEQQSPVRGEIEVDESYFGGKRIKGKTSPVYYHTKNKFDYWYRQAAYNISRGLKILRVISV